MDDLIERALQSNDPKVLQLAYRLVNNPLYKFKPRKDKAELFDQQNSFFNDRFDGISVALGGTASGKTYVGAARTAKFLAETPPPEKNTPYWICSQTMDMAADVAWRTLKQFLPDEYIESYVWKNQVKSQPRAIILKPHSNGNNWTIDIKSYDMEVKALQGQNVLGYWCDELAPMPVLREINARVRKWKYPGSRIYTLTPIVPDADPQNLQYVFENQEKFPQWKFYRLNTRLNKTLDPNFVQSIEQNELSCLIETRLTGCFSFFEGSIYPDFDQKVHVVKPFELPWNWEIIRGLDLGFSPGHATACVWIARDREKDSYYVFREYAAIKTSIEDHITAINDDWNKFRIQGPTYADPAAAQTLYEFSLRGLPTVSADKNVINGIANIQSLLRSPPRLFVFDTCQQLISEMKNYIWDTKKQDKPLKKNDNLCVAEGTFIETLEGPKVIEQITTNDSVLTRSGYRRVVAAACTGTRPTLTITTESGRQLTGTHDHPVWNGNDFVPMRKVMPDTNVFTWNQKSLFTTASNGGVTQMQNKCPTATITLAEYADNICQKNYTATCGPSTSGQSPRATTSTTKTTTFSTTTSATSNSLPQNSTPKSIGSGATTISKSAKETWTVFDHSLKNGTPRRKEGLGTVNTRKTPSANVSQETTNAKTVDNILPLWEMAETPIVLTTVNQPGGENNIWTTWSESAYSVESNSEQASIPKLKLVQDRVVASCNGESEKVYNLTVEGDHEYFANGILTHNCDAIRYGIFSHRNFNAQGPSTYKLPPREKHIKF